ncbi:enoyl-CoA hydratase/isomerase family protein [Ruicaihuangia caeni]|uniref:Enoyl-CoA hydratase/isomerase family protein n=1 Tax=Ruicaihuangia caeni TaxID=3042517 RepID=A0AAW6T9K0_9MICO|nr:enoyl-CoA hydratase/isomerase family protein [Klugiella sp. YN-L-19]MDI2098708.1 enoyl-CoA hydratase/isomerase family protein [Klugiella sp. YN-L-19]
MTGQPESRGILVRDHHDIRVITLQFPERRNALDLPARVELLHALRAAELQARAIVLTGANGFFSAGGDIRTMSDDPIEAGERLDVLAAIAQQIVHSSTPVVAAVEGGAYGMGLSLVSGATYVVGARSARFEASFGKIGLAPDTGLTWTLPRRIGPAKARRMMLTLLTLTGQTALEAGLVDELVDDGDALGRAMDVAGTLSRLSAPMVAGVSRLLAHEAGSLAEAAAAEGRVQSELLRSRESIDLRARFLEGTVKTRRATAGAEPN